MHWDLDDLVVPEVHEVSHDGTHPPELDLDAPARFVLNPDVFSPLNHLSVDQLSLHEAGKLLVGQGLLGLP